MLSMMLMILIKLLKRTDNSDLVITYRFKKKYKTSRIIISWIYNVVVENIISYSVSRHIYWVEINQKNAA